MLHIDIYSTDKNIFLACVDKFSKFAVAQPLPSKAIIYVRGPIIQLVNFFPKTKTIYCDNEAYLNSETINSLLKNQYSIDIVNAPPLHSSSNGQVERFHSTLTEIARCIKIDKQISDTVELVMRATVECNITLHSVTNLQPKDAMHSASDEQMLTIRRQIKKAQQANPNSFNPTRQNRIFEVGEKGYLRNNKRLGNKLTPLYTEERLQADLGTSVLVRRRVVHKDNLDTTPFSFSIGSHAPDTYTYLPYKLHSSLNLLFSYRIAGVELITLAVVNARVTDYSHAQYIPVTNGIALVWEQRHVLRHSSILTEFSAMIDETAKLSD